MLYKVNPETGLIDYEKLAGSARLFKPKVIIAGVSYYSRCSDYKKFRQIADENDSYLLGDMAQISGLVAAKVIPSPFDYCDVVSTTTHKTLRGPRAGIIFFRKGTRKVNGKDVNYDLEFKINMTVFPELQGGPHNHAIAGIAAVMKQAAAAEFVSYQKQVVANARQLSLRLQEFGYKICIGGTDIHLLLLDLTPTGLTGSKVEKVLEDISIACNKNTVPGDKSAFNLKEIRMETPALTTRGMKEQEFDQVAQFIHKGIELSTDPRDYQNLRGSQSKRHRSYEKIANLKQEVKDFAKKFPIPGADSL